MSLAKERKEAAKKSEQFEQRMRQKAEKAIEAITKNEDLEIRELGEILGAEGGIKFVEVPELGCKLAYRELSFDDFLDMREQGVLPRGKRKEVIKEVVFRCLHNADPKVTREDVGKIPLTVSTKIMNKIFGGPGLPLLKDQESE